MAINEVFTISTTDRDDIWVQSIAFSDPPADDPAKDPKDELAKLLIDPRTIIGEKAKFPPNLPITILFMREPAGVNKSPFVAEGVTRTSVITVRRHHKAIELNDPMIRFWNNLERDETSVDIRVVQNATGNDPAPLSYAHYHMGETPEMRFRHQYALVRNPFHLKDYLADKPQRLGAGATEEMRPIEEASKLKFLVEDTAALHVIYQVLADPPHGFRSENAPCVKMTGNVVGDTFLVNNIFLLPYVGPDVVDP